jgi:ABC-type branched-subunit amino acid transport system ATPase component
MLAISRALMLRPKLLLLDEPSFGLGPLVVQEIFRILRTINRNEGEQPFVLLRNRIKTGESKIDRLRSQLYQRKPRII